MINPKHPVLQFIEKMKFSKLHFFVLLLFFALPVNAQNLYVRTFGQNTSTPIIFLHGGPGYNCASFEVSTAQKLADAGYYVIVYDRRGEGRSESKAQFTFQQSREDLIGIMDSLKISSSHFIGHSFGGMLAVNLAEKLPVKVRSITLVGAPVSLQESFKTIIDSCEKIYRQKEDKTNLSYLKMLKGMDSTSIQYSSYCFMHAMQNGFYSPKNPSADALKLYALFKTDSILIANAAKMGHTQPRGFWKNEAYTTMNLSPSIQKLVNSKLPVFGLYGKEDGLYSKKQIEDLALLIGEDQLLYLDNCSHSVFVDQQQLFIDAIKNWTE